MKAGGLQRHNLLAQLSRVLCDTGGPLVMMDLSDLGHAQVPGMPVNFLLGASASVAPLYHHSCLCVRNSI